MPLNTPIKKVVLVKYLVTTGWSDQEDWGIWSLGKKSLFQFAKPEKPCKAIRFKGNYFNGDEKTKVWINGTLLGEFILANKIINIDNQSFSGDSVKIELGHSNIISPTSLGIGKDPREMK